MSQYGVNEGLRRFGKKGMDAVEKELRQVVDMDFFDPIHATYEE